MPTDPTPFTISAATFAAAAAKLGDLVSGYGPAQADQVVGAGAALDGVAQHQALRDTRGPHGGDVEKDADHRQPEVKVGETLRMQWLVPKTRRQPIEHTGGHEAVPTERAGVDMDSFLKVSDTSLRSITAFARRSACRESSMSF